METPERPSRLRSCVRQAARSTALATGLFVAAVALAGYPVTHPIEIGTVGKIADAAADWLDATRQWLDVSTYDLDTTGAAGTGRTSRLLNEAGFDIGLVIRSNELGAAVPDRAAFGPPQPTGTQTGSTQSFPFDLSNIGSARSWASGLFNELAGLAGAQQGEGRRRAALTEASRSGLANSLATQTMAAGDASHADRLRQLADQAADRRDQESVLQLLIARATDEIAIRRQLGGSDAELGAAMRAGSMGALSRTPAP